MMVVISRFAAEGCEKPDSVREALKLCDERVFPNVHTLLRLACTLPVSSNPCERSNSALRRLHHYTRTTMSEDRLTNLALLHIHSNATFDYDEAVNIFARKHPRRMELECVLKD